MAKIYARNEARFWADQIFWVTTLRLLCRARRPTHPEVTPQRNEFRRQFLASPFFCQGLTKKITLKQEPTEWKRKLSIIIVIHDLQARSVLPTTVTATAKRGENTVSYQPKKIALPKKCTDKIRRPCLFLHCLYWTDDVSLSFGVLLHGQCSIVLFGVKMIW